MTATYHWRIWAVFAVTAALGSGVAQPQTKSAARPEFEVATVKPARMARTGGEGSGRESVAITPNGVTLTNASLSFCLQWAYNVRFYQVSGPGELARERYDITAKTTNHSDDRQLRLMTRALLADRFRLRLHRETKSIPVFELAAASKTLKLTLSRSDRKPAMTVENGSFVFHNITMPDFAERLSDFSAFDRPVLDRTGMEGSFDITLKSAATAMREDPNSIFSAVEAVGLRLNNRKGPVEMLVVDHAEKPSGN